eukprot:TRINITY_DN9158_c0_g1_i1.p1 TRINITY_DN9158_c0_g1~~TRINITY_DN9158_c0_g1_i1.p1  ORF type:complete len:262 (+),score=37.00 TRINITY_DN9158_c0_g1_i1:62-847(+)
MVSTMMRVVLLLFLGLVTISANCQYRARDGSMFDFSPLDVEDYFVPNSDDQGWHAWLSFCRPLKKQLCGDDSAGCQEWDPSSLYGHASIGKASKMKWSETKENGKLVILANFAEGWKNRTMQVRFHCDPSSGNGSPTFLDVTNKNLFIFVWRTAHACVKDDCSRATDCSTCTNSEDLDCQWCIDEAECVPFESNCKNWLTSPRYCSLGCDQFKTCDDCLNHNDQCDWCLEAQKCIADVQGGCSNVINQKGLCNLNNHFLIH